MDGDDVPTWDDLPDEQPQNEIPIEVVKIPSSAIFVGNPIQNVLNKNIAHIEVIKIEYTIGAYMLTLKLNQN
jgi:hypothetical protein